MKIKGLRKKISFVLIVSLTIGILLTTLAPFIYLLMFYPKLLQDYTDKMITNQKHSLTQVSSTLAKAISYSYVQKIFNFINVGGDLMDQYLFYGLDTNINMDHEMVYQNYFVYNKDPNPKDLSTWIYQNINKSDELSPNTLENLNTSSIFDPILRAITNVGKIESKNQSTLTDKDKNCSLYLQNYLAFTNDGLYYVNPPLKNSFLDNSTLCKNDSSCTYCNKSISEEYYDPRCRNFYNDTKNRDTFEAILIDPYNFTNNCTGQSICRGQWNFTSSELVFVFCADFGYKDVYDQTLSKLTNEKPTYTYIISVSTNLMAYKEEEIAGNKSVFYTKEFGGNNSESRKFDKSIMPLFQNQVSEFKYYTKYGHKMMAAINPILMVTTSGLTVNHVASVAVVMKKSHFESKFDDLRATGSNMMKVMIIVQLCFLVPILGFCILLTDKITKNIILPIDRLAKILKKMKEGDLAVDIIASYEESPREISCLYEVFDKLRVVLRFSAISPENMTEAFFVYSQALNLFIKFGNERGIEVCYREMGYICFKQKQWETSAQYLNESLVLATKLGIYTEEEIAKRRTETAKAYIKAGIDREYAMNLFGEALQTFQAYGDLTRVVMCSIEIAETLLEVKQLKPSLLDFIEKKLEKCDNFERTVANQRFLFIKSCYLKSVGMFQEACVLVSNILDFHADFIPEIWMNSINLLISICTEKGIDWSSLEPLRSFRRFNKKDIVLIISDSLTKGLISWNLLRFLKSILEENDRLSVLQFGSTFKVNFNLTRFPLKIFDLQEAKLITDEKRVLYDCIQEGFRQLRVNSLYKKKEGVCKECIIIITDCVDSGSKSKFVDFIKALESTDVEVIIVNCFLEVRVFESLRMATEKCSIFHIRYQEQAKIVLKEIEAYLCPYKEVYLVDN